MINQQTRFCPMCHNTPQICQCNPKPKKEWVGLTDEDRWELVQKTPSFDEAVTAVEAKLKEKNNGNG